MADEPENHTLAYLRRIDAKLDRVLTVLGDHGHRMTRLDAQMAGMRRDMGSDAEAVAQLQARMDHMQEQIDHLTRGEELLD